MRNFLKGKKMWGYVSGTYMIPKNIEEGDVVLIDTWEANNAKIITWINNSVEHSIGTQLCILCLVMLSSLSIYLSFLFHPLLIA